MKALTIAALATLFATPALADREAGVPLRPAQAAGAWSLQKNGHTLCVLDLRTRRSNEGYVLRSRGDCGDALSGRPVAWAPTSGGMKLVGADGQAVATFGRWSNSLFVSPPGSGVDLQLRRGL